MNSKLKRRLLWALTNVLRLLVASVFIFSGVVKLIDPYGTAYKIEDYGQSFGVSGILVEGLPLLLSIALSVCEFMLGIYLVFGIRRRMTTRVILLFMLCMTPLTLYLAIYDPVKDCGCFGDAVTLSNWQTFGKNVVLLVAAFVLCRYFRTIRRVISERNQWTVSLFSWVFALIFASINIYRLPLIDFRPYHIGANLAEEYARRDEATFETVFVLEKDGERREFTLDNYPDSTWTFVDSHTMQTSGTAGESPLAELQILSQETGEDVTTALLNHDGYTFLLVAPYLEKADDGVMDRLTDLYDYCVEHGYAFYCLTSSSEEAIVRWRDMTGAEYPFCYVDAVVLKTMVRANPGLMLLHEGRVVNKWATDFIPKESALSERLETSPLAHFEKGSSVARIVTILLWYLIPLFVFTLADRFWIAFKLSKLHKY